ncbi:MAG: hypothetical protein JWR19_528 [Pedosphaera sp.]|nr:hypothetical protein [Pedosphaera sp.]
MSDTDKSLQIKIGGDASSLVSAAKEGEEALKSLQQEAGEPTKAGSAPGERRPTGADSSRSVVPDQLEARTVESGQKLVDTGREHLARLVQLLTDHRNILESATRLFEQAANNDASLLKRIEAIEVRMKANHNRLNGTP